MAPLRRERATTRYRLNGNHHGTCASTMIGALSKIAGNVDVSSIE